MTRFNEWDDDWDDQDPEDECNHELDEEGVCLGCGEWIDKNRAKIYWEEGAEKLIWLELLLEVWEQ